MNAFIFSDFYRTFTFSASLLQANRHNPGAVLRRIGLSTVLSKKHRNRHKQKALPLGKRAKKGAKTIR